MRQRFIKTSYVNVENGEISRFECELEKLFAIEHARSATKDQ